ncbi:Protein FAR-RED IMPAIRED RESPONSE 1 [Abeliophyllum distichum]|uniref:Protein FAR-RED IMPAIRED RESPONSE 1 n=1 Tax=Abeliophyllum distichum TaxID=126358 RepID=A0ABD1NQH8_9LAMI
MPRQASNLIITNQDAAITKAISMVMPSTFHRYCLWRILNKFSEKMNVMVYNEQYHLLVNIIKNSESPMEFEKRWYAIMDSTSLDCNEWLTSMYELRTRWVPAYVKHIFNMGMSSSQSTSLMAIHGLLTHKSSVLIDDAALIDTRTTFFMEEFDSLHIRIKEIYDGENAGFSKNKDKIREQNEPNGDPSAIRAKGCGKSLKSSKEKLLSKSNKQCGCCGEMATTKEHVLNCMIGIVILTICFPYHSI